MTFMVLAPEHRLVAELTSEEQHDAVEAYVQATLRASELERAVDGAREDGRVHRARTA